MIRLIVFCLASTIYDHILIQKEQIMLSWKMIPAYMMPYEKVVGAWKITFTLS